MIKLIDLISMAGIKLYDYKIHCATGKEWPPMEAFFDGKFKQWQEQQNQENFKCKHILSLIHLRNDYWLFAGVYKVNGVKPRQCKGKRCYLYSTQEAKGLEHLTGKAIIQFQKNFRASYLRPNKFEDQLLLIGLRDHRVTIGDFPGYHSILLSFRMLKTVVRESNPSWKSAISSVAGVYLITDTSDGKQYVGKASGGNGYGNGGPNMLRTGMVATRNFGVCFKKRRLIMRSISSFPCWKSAISMRAMIILVTEKIIGRMFSSHVSSD